MRLLVRSLAVVTAVMVILLAIPWVSQSRRLWRLEHADVNADVEASLRHNDFRLLGIEGGGGIVVPAVSDSLYQLAVSRPCTRVIYVGDAFYSDSQLRTHNLSITYAAAYNQRLLTRAGATRICAQAG